MWENRRRWFLGGAAVCVVAALISRGESTAMTLYMLAIAAGCVVRAILSDG